MHIYKLFQTAASPGPGFTDGLAISGTTPVYSGVVSALNTDGLSVQFLWNGTNLVGGLKMFASNLQDPSLASDKDWTELTGFSVIGPAATDLAELDLNTVTGDLNTVIKARSAGGSEITVEVNGSAVASSGVTLVEDLVARTVVITFETGVSTVANVETAIGTSTLIAVKTAGTGATVLDTATDETTGAIALIGGNRSSSEEVGNLHAAKVRWKFTPVSGSGTLFGYAVVSRGV